MHNAVYFLFFVKGVRHAYFYFERSCFAFKVVGGNFAAVEVVFYADLCGQLFVRIASVEKVVGVDVPFDIGSVDYGQLGSLDVYDVRQIAFIHKLYLRKVGVKLVGNNRTQTVARRVEIDIYRFRFCYVCRKSVIDMLFRCGGFFGRGRGFAVRTAFSASCERDCE